MKVVLLAAGFGSRLWPLSTSDKPKQFQQLLGEQTLIQYSHSLYAKVIAPGDIYVLTLKGLEHWVHEQLPELAEDHIIAVPERRNTLPHTIFALQQMGITPSEQVLFTGIDTFISEPDALLNTIQSYINEAGIEDRPITLLGSSADRIDNNAGYIQAHDGQITAFVEKPDTATIEKLSKEGTLYKNIFTYFLSQDNLRAALEHADASVKASATALLNADPADQQTAFLAMPFCDISNGLFAVASDLQVRGVASDFIDLGSFATLHHINDKDADGNVVHGKVILDGNCTNNYIVNQLDQPLVVIDTSDSVIVQTADGSLCAPISQSSRVGDIYKHQIHSNQSKH